MNPCTNSSSRGGGYCSEGLRPRSSGIEAAAVCWSLGVRAQKPRAGGLGSLGWGLRVVRRFFAGHDGLSNFRAT